MIGLGPHNATEIYCTPTNFFLIKKSMGRTQCRFEIPLGELRVQPNLPFPTNRPVLFSTPSTCFHQSGKTQETEGAANPFTICRRDAYLPGLDATKATPFSMFFLRSPMQASRSLLSLASISPIGWIFSTPLGPSSTLLEKKSMPWSL